MAMRDCFTRATELRARRNRIAEFALEKYSFEKMAGTFMDAIHTSLGEQEAR